MVGTEIQLYVVDHKPPGPWFNGDGNGGLVWYDLPTGGYTHGSMVAVGTNDGPGAIYNQLYVYIDNPSGSQDDDGSWEFWKKVDLNWPKIDPRTGQPFDQYLDWYSPLAE